MQIVFAVIPALVYLAAGLPATSSGMTIGTLFTLFVLPAVYVAIATDHRAGAESQRAKQIADFDNADMPHGVLKPT